MRRKINKKNSTIITIIFTIILLIFLSTIAYSAFSSTMNITGFAHARVEANVRITDFKIASVNNAISLYEEFGKSHINSSINLKTSQSTITYYVEITNYGSTDVGIYNITGLPENLNYQIKDYNLKDKICDETGKCNSFIKKTLELTITTTSSFEGNINLEFDIRPFHKITYVNFNNTYKSEFISKDKVILDLSKDAHSIIGVESSSDISHTYNNYILTFENASSDVLLTGVKNSITSFSYTGNIQTYTAPINGVYKLEVWGASGGDVSLEVADNMSILSARGGTGGYSSGYIKLQKNDTIYIVVGGAGEGTSNPYQDLQGGYNGGGSCYAKSTINHIYGAGGGATHIASKTGVLSELYNYKDQIFLVAGGGGGARIQENNTNPAARYGDGGAGGGLRGISATGYGGDGTMYYYPERTSGQDGPENMFGQGKSITGNGGGGGGYYGGCSGEGIDCYGSSEYIGPGGGGSGYIGGVHEGTTIAGNEQIPTYNETGTMLGNKGNGYAKITIVDNKTIEYTITYEGLNENYPSSILSGKNLTIDLSNENTEIIQVYINDIPTTNYTLIDNILTIPNITGNVKIASIYEKYQSNLVSYYPFTKDLADHSITKRYGDLITFYGTTPSIDTNGVRIYNTGLRSQTNNQSLPENFTAIIDFNPTSLESNYHHIWGFWQGDQGITRYNSLSYYAGEVQIQNGSTRADIPNVLTTNKWYRLVVVGTKNNWKLYIDGVHIHTMESTYNKKTSYLYVGKNINEALDQGEPSIDGYLKNFRIYDTVMEENDIASLGGSDQLKKYSIKYDGLSGNYPTTITKGENLILNLSNETINGLEVSLNGTKTNDYTFQNGILTINNVTSNIEIKTIYAKYKNNLQSYYPLTSDINDHSTRKLFGDLTSTVTHQHSTNGILIDSAGLKTISTTTRLPSKFTIMIDFKPLSLTNTWHHIWGIWQGGNYSESYNSLAHNGAELHIQNGKSSQITTTAPLKENEWNKIIVVNDYSKWIMYLNGTKLIELEEKTSYKTGSFYIGQNFQTEGTISGEPSINGYIKDLRIYNIPMTDEEIANIGSTK